MTRLLTALLQALVVLALVATADAQDNRPECNVQATVKSVALMVPLGPGIVNNQPLQNLDLSVSHAGASHSSRIRCA